MYLVKKGIIAVVNKMTIEAKEDYLAWVVEKVKH